MMMNPSRNSCGASRRISAAALRHFRTAISQSSRSTLVLHKSCVDSRQLSVCGSWVSLQHQLQQQRHMASSVAGIRIPDSLKETVKSTLLDHAVREDSGLWQKTGFNAVDPLDDLDLEQNQETRYWPHLPPLVAAVDPFDLAKTEIALLVESIRDDMISTDHPVLKKAASYFFQSAGDGGKKIRPMLVLLLSRALSEHYHYDSALLQSGSPPPPVLLTSKNLMSDPLAWQRPDLRTVQRLLAQVAEIFHTASLLHDDVLDDADTRRNLPTVHTTFGSKIAILAGDYLLARASVTLARMGNLQVVDAMSTVLEHLVLGEVMQMRGQQQASKKQNSASLSLARTRLVYYLRKNFYKTASLMAHSCQSVALLGDYPEEIIDASYRFGKHVGMAFQLVDDVLDFEGSQQHLGKPPLADLRSGLATAPVLFAAEEFPGGILEEMMQRKFKHEGDVERTVEMVMKSQGMARTQQLARLHAEAAMDALLPLRPSPCRDALIQLAYRVVSRTR